MVQFIIFLILGVAGIVIGRYLAVCNKMKKAGGLAVHTKKQQEIKEERKGKILELVRTRENITNNDVEKLLDVSDATATNYLQELEDEGKIEQIGKQGRFVSYKLKING